MKAFPHLCPSNPFQVVIGHPIVYHGFQNWTGSGGWTVKTENRDKNRFFKPKELDFLLIL